MCAFAPLHVHSNYSLCRGSNQISDICRHSRAMGWTHLAITDTNGLYGLGWFLQEAADQHLQPVIGSLLSIGERHAVLLAKNLQGYHRLCQLITAIHQDERFDLTASLTQDHQNLVVLSRDVPLLRAIIESGQTQDVYVELVPYLDRESLLRFARENRLACVASQAAYFISPDDFSLHKLLRAIALNTTLSALPASELVSPSAHLSSMDELFPDCPEALANTIQIAQQCSFSLNFGKAIFPAFHGPQGENAHSYLEELVRKGVIWRYGALTPEIHQRMEHELDLIESKGFAPYFLVVADAVRQAPRTCGRGSAASSLVSYCLGITNVDPIKYDLFFERFLNPGRTDPPDIDVDFPWDERDDVLDYLFKKYGPGRVAMIANHNTFKARSALREIAKVYGLPEAEITAITKRISSYWQPDQIQKMVEGHPVFKNVVLQPPWPEIIVQAEQIRGFPRHLSIHCGGVVIAPDGLDHYVPLQPAKKILRLTGALTEGGLPRDVAQVQVVQWEKDQAEEMGLVKMDILGNRSLAVIRDTLRAIKKNYGITIDYATWNPLEDSATQTLLARGETIGVFYVESPAMRQLQIKTGKGDFEHLVIHSSIIRPAANYFINEYVRRLRGVPYEPLHPRIQEILRETFGIMVYQEDVSKVAMALANFDASSADGLRKIIAKKHKQKQLRDYRERFFQGAKENGIAHEVGEKIWDMILSFCEYSFCKAHSASYAQVSFKSAYLKVYYPAEFLSAVISNQGGYYSTLAYVSEARRLGLEILPLDINESEDTYTGRQRAVRIGLMQIKDLSQQARRSLLQERRENGPFQSFENFLRRLRLDSSDVSLLVKSGCFDGLDPHRSRPSLLWQALARQSQKRSAAGPRTADLFHAQADVAVNLPQPAMYDERTLLQQETECLGLLLSRHPLTLYREKLAKLNYVPACDLHQNIGKIVQTIGWLITYKLVSTKKKELMEFLSFEDTTAIYETTFFPKTYARFAHMMTDSRPYRLTGRVEEQYGAVTLNVQHIDYL